MREDDTPIIALAYSLVVMAFDRPIEADRVDDLGLISSLIRAPVMGIMWLLGGQHTEKDDGSTPTEKVPSLDCISGHSSGGDVEDYYPTSTTEDIGPVALQTDRPNKENDSFSSRQTSADVLDSSATGKESKLKRRMQSSSQLAAMDPALEMIDDLAAVIGGSLTSPDKMRPSSTNALISVSHSAPAMSHRSSFNRQSSMTSTLSNPSCNNMRGNKKTSWSDECGKRLVECAYFDDSPVPRQSSHWSSMRRNNAAKRSLSPYCFENAEKGLGGPRRGEVRRSRGILKRSGSYSPPETQYPSNSNSKDLTPSSSYSPPENQYVSNNSMGLRSSSSDSSSSTQEMKPSFRSLSVIGSDDSNMTLTEADEESKSESSNSNVPSTLQVGCGKASGGLIIPRGGPSAPRYHFPGGSEDSRYKLILGAGLPSVQDSQVDASNEQVHAKLAQDGELSCKQPLKDSTSSNPTSSKTFLASGRNSPGSHLPRPPAGHISPQYGFYVNITPPTPDFFQNPHAPASPGYMQFHHKRAPSPIPEGERCEGRFVGGSSVPRPKNRSSHERHQSYPASVQSSSMKPTFNKNMKGIDMLLSECSWPSVPLG